MQSFNSEGIKRKEVGGTDDTFRASYTRDSSKRSRISDKGVSEYEPSYKFNDRRGSDDFNDYDESRRRNYGGDRRNHRSSNDHPSSTGGYDSFNHVRQSKYSRDRQGNLDESAERMSKNRDRFDNRDSHKPTNSNRNFLKSIAQLSVQNDRTDSDRMHYTLQSSSNEDNPLPDEMSKNDQKSTYVMEQPQLTPEVSKLSEKSENVGDFNVLPTTNSNRNFLRSIASLSVQTKTNSPEEVVIEKPKFLSKDERRQLRNEKPDKRGKRHESEHRQSEHRTHHDRSSHRQGEMKDRRKTSPEVKPDSSPVSGELSKTDSYLAELDLLNIDDKPLLSSSVLNSSTGAGALTPKEKEQIKEHYLGLRKEKKKIQKPSEKFRNIFNFEWDATEDTARGDSNPLYQNRVEPQLLFGRGFRAGVDIREQRKHNNFYDELVKRRMLKSDEDDSTLSKMIEHSRLLKERDMEPYDPNKSHWTLKARDDMTDRDWRILREDFEIYIKGGRVPNPIRAWKEAELPRQLLDAVQAAGYKEPTPIQMQAIPIAMEQRDLIGIAETGSGKTAAFVLPLLSYVGKLPALTDDTSQDGPYSLVLAPARELALQIEEETRKFATFCDCRVVAVVGGRNAEAQSFQLSRGAEVVIGTPGRVKDVLEKSYTVLNQCNYVVLDEADRMIDLGFEEVVNWILDQIPATNLKSEDEDQAFMQELEAKAGHRQYRLTHMFSATMPPAVERLARKYLRAPSYISVGDPGAGKRSIEQRVEFVSEAKKKQRLHDIISKCDPPIMIFANQKKVADVIARQLQKSGHSATSLHGGKSQDVREASLQGFKDGDYDILVATDVAGRGIDVEGVQLVVNYDMPKDIESYTHRIGRTGRAGRKGQAISFISDDDSGLFFDLKNLLQSTNNFVPPDLAQHPASKNKPGSIGVVKK